jgi:hypothetical protein
MVFRYKTKHEAELALPGILQTINSGDYIEATDNTLVAYLEY